MFEMHDDVRRDLISLRLKPGGYSPAVTSQKILEKIFTKISKNILQNKFQK